MIDKATSQTRRRKYVFLLGGTLAFSGASAFSLDFGPATSALDAVALALLLALGGALWVKQREAARLARQLKKSSSRIESLLSSINGIHWEADADTSRFTFVSPQAERLLGYPLADWYRPNFWFEHLHPDDRAVQAANCLVCARQQAHDCEFRFMARDGRVVWLHRQCAFTEDDGPRTLASGLLIDITERRAQQEEARLALLERDTILQNALVGIVYLKHRRVISCNRRFEELFHYGPGELIGVSTQMLYDSPATFDDVGERAYPTLAENRKYSQELMMKHKDGSLFRGALTGCAIDPAQPQEGSIWIYADISERHHAEQEIHKLLQAVEQSPVSIVITSREGLIEYVNPRFTKVTGYTRDEAIGQNPRILQSGETPPETYQELWATLLGGNEWRGILRNRRKNGELFWEEASVSPIINERGEMTHFLAVKEDVTERIRVQQELIDHQIHLDEMVRRRTAELSTALEAAKLADHAKDQFLANISHELRTPLNAVIGLSEMARRISSDARQQDYLDKVTNAGKTLSLLINDLLDLSKIAAGRMEFEQITFSLRKLIGNSTSVLRHKTVEKGLRLVEQVDQAVPDILVGDPLRFEQILLNLICNAIKFTLAGQITIRVGVRASETSRICLAIEIEDTGVGLSEEAIALLFKPFVQADASMTRKFGGTGLGLSICKLLAEKMGGDIRVSSREGQGSIFCVTLWLALGRAEDLPAVEAPGEDASLLRYRDVRILVVDDQPLNREIVEALLDVVGIVPREATNGQEALELLDEAGADAFDLVLMDIQMPIMDGLTATRALRGRAGFNDLPVIAMTAHTMAHEKEISKRAGMNDHIGKPFDNAGFYRTLAQWIPVEKRVKQGPAPAEIKPVRPSVAAGRLAALVNIDTATGIGRFGGKEERYLSWLNLFVEEGPATVAEIRQLLGSSTSEAASRVAHAFKGRVGMLGMSELHPVVSALETTLRAAEPADELLDKVEEIVKQTSVEIKAVLARLEPLPASAAGLPQTGQEA